ncbi:MAG: DUF1800 domain-containing protein [Acidobacteria bacterium]|nr:DUF1800 domain-containing protein [Acidobacteriota bacterium]
MRYCLHFFVSPRLLPALLLLSLTTASGQTPPITITLDPSPSGVRAGLKFDFNATVANTTNKAVKWLVNDVEGGNLTLGTISTLGLYQAPAKVYTTRVAIKVKSVADPTKFVSRGIDIWNPIAKITDVAPDDINQGHRTEIIVKGSLFVAGAKIYADRLPLSTTFVSDTELRTSLDTSAAPTTRLKVLVRNPEPESADSNYQEMLVLPPVVVTASPKTVNVRLSAKQDFNARVDNSRNRAVIWYVNGIKSGNATIGTIDEAGLYTAPAVLPAPTVEIKAVSAHDSTKSDTATVTLLHAIPVITTAPPSLKTGPNSFTIAGTGFAKTATVEFNGQPIPAVWVNSNRITLSGLIKPSLGGYGTLRVLNPAPGPANSAFFPIPVNPSKAVMTVEAASRFLEQASWGPTPESLNHLLEVGREAWLAEQFATPPSTYPDPLDTGQSLNGMQKRFFLNALTGPDQLRQRIAFALGQIFVVSGVELSQYWQMVSLQREFLAQAFGNYRSVMQSVTLSPTMGDYLDMVNNDKPNPAKGYVPNENYARETLQLFTLGLSNLSPAGARLPGTPYTEEDVKQLALAFTGWTYPPEPGFASRWTNRRYYIGPMVAFQDHHDTTNKMLLGKLLPGGRSAQADLDQALDVIFQHSNVGPFVALRLIQKLTTSNPSAAYITRVTDSFNASPRGDLKRVITAILLDPEAGTGPGGTLSSSQGHLREPVLFATTLVRALDAAVGPEPGLAPYTEWMGQRLFYSPSVFNYYSPLYRLPSSGVPAPEFQILNPTTALARINFVNSAAGNQLGGGIDIPVEHFEALAATPSVLVDAVSRALMRGTMKADMKAEITKAISVTDNPRWRVRIALYLTATQSRFQVQQ